ncbi:MAG: hypothetical protein FRX48_08321 [Lasallia pustulata]|uniref:Uncharacterized protein n=1 Tax=Lasallia pustulata TaxID=136370 RepID=A0A5M8PGE9_9LECA|nr:MAG: hypothetical protein FRX48_08321 [Lasallia pustulata]
MKYLYDIQNTSTLDSFASIAGQYFMSLVSSCPKKMLPTGELGLETGEARIRQTLHGALQHHCVHTAHCDDCHSGSSSFDRVPPFHTVHHPSSSTTIHHHPSSSITWQYYRVPRLIICPQSVPRSSLSSAWCCQH